MQYLDTKALIGFFALMVGAILVGFIAERTAKRFAARRNPPDASGRVECPHCRERIMAEAAICPFCHRPVGAQSVGQRAAGLFIVAVLTVAFVAYYVYNAALAP